MKHEIPTRRYFEQSPSVEIRSDGESKKPVICGMAARYHDPAVTGTEYRKSLPTGWQFVERIDKGAFDSVLSGDKGDIVALWQHDMTRPLGRRSAGTLRLESTTDGLRYEIDPPSTTWGLDAIESIRRGDVRGSSFGFRADKETWAEDRATKTLTRTIHSFAELQDVSPVTNPAYLASSATLRNESQVIDVAETENRDKDLKTRIEISLALSQV